MANSEYQKQWQKNNIDKSRSYSKTYYLKNKARFFEKGLRFRKNHPDIVKE